MPRLHVIESALAQSGAPLNLATVRVYDPGTTNLVSLGLLFAGPTGATTIASNPITTGANGAIEFWLDDSTGVTDVDLNVQHPSVTTFTTRWQPRVPADLTVTTTRTQTLTNKTLTAPVITGGTASGLAFSLSDGTVADPVAKFTAEATTGIYRPATGGIGIAVQGSARLIATTASLSVLKGSINAIQASAGSVGTPVTMPSFAGGSERYGVIEGVLYSAMTNAVEGGAVTGRTYAQSGTDGYAVGLWGAADAQGSWATSGENGIIAVVGRANGGTVAGATVKGANFLSFNAAGTQVGGLMGVEVNVSNYSVNVGRTVLALGVTQGPSAYAGGDTEQDVHLRLTGKLPSVGTYVGISFGAPSFTSGSPTTGVIFPVRTGGTLIKADGVNRSTGANASIGIGIDFGGMTFTSYAFLSNGFSVAPSGLVSAVGLTLPTGNLLVTAGNLTVSAGEIVSSGVIKISTNNVGIQLRDGGGTYRTVLRSDGTSSVHIGEGTAPSVILDSVTFSLLNGCTVSAYQSGNVTLRAVLTMTAGNVVQVGNANNNMGVLAAAYGIFTKSATPAGQQSVNAACTDLATAVALTNQIRTALINFGYCV